MQPGLPTHPDKVLREQPSKPNLDKPELQIADLMMT